VPLTLTIVEAILPILFTLSLGFFAGYRRQFDPQNASILIRMVMLYALPLSLLGAILGMNRAQILNAGPIAALIALAMAGGYVLAFAIQRLLLKRGTAESALIAFAISGPSVPFIGIPVLGQLFGPASAVPISVGSLLMNLFQLPLAMILIGSAEGVERGSAKNLLGHIAHSCREPVVWVPLSALALVLCGFHLPPALKGTLGLLGHATGGAALFASGIVLHARRVRFSLQVSLVVLCRNILIPLVIFALALAFKLPNHVIQESTLTTAIPTASVTVILAMRYHLLEREVASVLFFGTLSAIATMAGFIWLTGATITGH